MTGWMLHCPWARCIWPCRRETGGQAWSILSTRGVQYASHAYTDLLKDKGIEISMSRKANPWDNAACESFMKTLKHEEVYRTEYRHLGHARSAIGDFLEK